MLSGNNDRSRRVYKIRVLEDDSKLTLCVAFKNHCLMSSLGKELYPWTGDQANLPSAFNQIELNLELPYLGQLLEQLGVLLLPLRVRQREQMTWFEGPESMLTEGSDHVIRTVSRFDIHL